jgi:hypothetical protein
MLFRASFLTRPDLDSDDFEPHEGLNLGGEIDFPQEGMHWRLVEIETGPGEQPPTLIFESAPSSVQTRSSPVDCAVSP